MSVEMSIPSVLERILRDKRLQVEAARARVSERELRERAEARRRAEPGRDFRAALRPPFPGVPAVIAELKRASPSRGVIREDFEVSSLAAGYQAAGAAALSVLTEEDHFQGQLEYLELARGATRLPILRKDFLFCNYQVWEAAAGGADAILLIAAMLDDATLRGLLATARRAGLAALCEVHDGGELDRVLAAGADLVGVNNRDLHTFAVDVERAVELAGRLPCGVVGVAESGLRRGADLARMAAAGYQAVLIGEAFMQAPEPGQALGRMLREILPEAAAPAGFVKICGLTNYADARAACAAGADAVGFVFADSPRQVSPERVRQISPKLAANVLRVGVFAATPVREIRTLAAACGLHAAQLHGPYTLEDGAWLAARVPVWRALAMPAEAEEALAWAPLVERFVLDTAVPGQLGGTGKSFAWESARGLAARAPRVPMLVAGGLRPDNVAAAIARSGAQGVDVASGLESAPGKKDHAAMEAFVREARAAFGSTKL